MARVASIRRPALVASSLLVAIVAVAALSLASGDVGLGLDEVIGALGRPNGDDDASYIVWTLRFPRMVTAIVVGAAFGVAGAVFQSVLRNPLASPDVIGVTAGASAAAVSTVVLTTAATTAHLSAAALVGAVVAALLVQTLASDLATPSRLVMTGIGVAALFTSATSFLITQASAFDAQRAVVWLTGSFYGRGWSHAGAVAIALVMLAVPLSYLHASLETLHLGDDVAAALGVSVARDRRLLLLLATLLAAVATAAAGPVAFVAFLAPQLARRIAGSPHALWAAALTGAFLVASADLAARRAFAPTEVPAGAVTGAIGGTYLAVRVFRARDTSHI